MNDSYACHRAKPWLCKGTNDVKKVDHEVDDAALILIVVLTIVGVFLLNAIFLTVICCFKKDVADEGESETSELGLSGDEVLLRRGFLPSAVIPRKPESGRKIVFESSEDEKISQVQDATDLIIPPLTDVPSIEPIKQPKIPDLISKEPTEKKSDAVVDDLINIAEQQEVVEVTDVAMERPPNQPNAEVDVKLKPGSKWRHQAKFDTVMSRLTLVNNDFVHRSKYISGQVFGFRRDAYSLINEGKD